MPATKEISDNQLLELWTAIKDQPNQQKAMNEILLNQYADYIVYTAESRIIGDNMDCDGAYFRRHFAIVESDEVEKANKDRYWNFDTYVMEQNIKWLYKSSMRYDQGFNPEWLLENLKTIVSEMKKNTI